MKYYYYPQGVGRCEHCHASLPRYLIGMKLDNRVFALRVSDYKERWSDWLKRIKRADSAKAVIADETGRVITLAELERLVTAPDRYYAADADGVAASNKSPNGCGRYDKKLGLLRVDAPSYRRPYDLVPYDF